jgi:coenzyme F420-reducing hydrogenase delta subunit/Pyruvate/2-oxoacid:ferredoxin oxidoreductase delta subunit
MKTVMTPTDSPNQLLPIEPIAADARPSSVRSVAGDQGASDAVPSQPPLPSGILRQFDKGFIYLDRLIGRWVPGSLNPMLHTGAIAVTTLFIATLTGIVLLVWYKPSVHLAYESLDAMSRSPFGAGLMRSLHRYSSDAAVLFGVIHALRVFFERRFEGARWLAWVTGAGMMGLLWFVGWTGYWLVWDLRAQSIAVGTAKLLDVLPVFTDPLSRSFVTDESVNSLLFFVVFFIHMIVPLAMAVAMWLHITRLARPRFLTSKAMTLWVFALLLLISIAYPATNEAPAQMTAILGRFTMDWWFLFPIPIIDRLGAGASWGLLVFGSAVSISIPWWLARERKQPASVIPSRCNECKKCFSDCPYEAIEMIERTDGNERYLTQASVIESKCVSCGICAGSCDTMGIGLDWFSSIEQRRLIGSWMKQANDSRISAHVAFVCAESAGAGFDIDPVTGLCAELPGYRVLRVPCAGWVQPLMIERAIRQGALGVLIATCPPDQCSYREGAEWEHLRIEGVREPALRIDKLEPGQVQLVALDRTRKADLIRAAERFRVGEELLPAHDSPRALAAVAATVLLAAIAGLLGLVSDFAYTPPGMDGSEFVVSLKHPGLASENCRDLTPEELASTPIHMRKERVCERTRPSVRVRVVIDGATALETSVAPSGIWKDGNSVSVERIPVAPGAHRVSVAIGESTDPEEWSFDEERTITFTDEARQVVVFDRVAGFTWH